ncbi:hypothetical protein [Kitasatospora atroaurantiaca]|uniref:Zinc ribbon domain-containing protein n=1 Tax=Kitasatospora atroaurantiaca TaxID=285545 RepID=A0A561EQ87_9ACTN|nr:hypothetical protein [Kitasatospora atroaurantiaca]TWE17770.1 hypothetical protein FB465_2808 [Kitasatospora atroaurantiaca]
MAICAACGAASAGGAQHCASCGRPFAPPPAISEVSEVVGGVTTSPPPVGSWGAGVPFEPAAGRSAALRWFTEADWRPALRAVIAPTALLLLVALVVAAPESEMYGRLPFGSRFGVALALTVSALGAPLSGRTSMGESAFSMTSEMVLRALPLTVTLLWLVLLRLGLGAGLRARRRHGEERITGRQACEEAARTALLAVAATAALGWFAGIDFTPSPRDGMGFILGAPSGGRITVEAGWLQAAGWALLLAGLLALSVYGTDVLRWAAWQRPAVRGWLVGALVAGRALAVTLGLASLAGFILVAAQGEAPATWASLAFLPNLGLLLLGVGSGATVGVSYRQGGSFGVDERSLNDSDRLSLFDLHGESGNWRWTLALAVVGAAVLGWSAYRRRLDLVGRLKLAAAYAVALSLLMLGAGLTTSSVISYHGGTGDLGGLNGGALRESTSHTSLGLAVLGMLAANLLWTALGALALPALPALPALFGTRSRPSAGAGDGAGGLPPVQPVAAAPAAPQEPPAPPYASELLDSHGES